MPLDLALGSTGLSEAEHHQAHIDGVGGDANEAEIVEHKEEDPGQVDRTSKRHQGAQHQQDRCPAGPEATCKAEKGQTQASGTGHDFMVPLRKQGLLGKSL